MAGQPDLDVRTAPRVRSGPRRERIEASQLVPFVDLSIVNELDVIDQNPAMLEKHGTYFADLFARWAPAASPSVIAEARRVLAGRA
jgi:hypothetical protein